MNNSGSVSPACFLLAADGQRMLTPRSLTDCVMLLEAWAKFTRPGGSALI